MEAIPFWRKFSEIDVKYQNFIFNISNRIVIYSEDNGTFYCSKCLHTLNENYYCLGCFRQYYDVVVDGRFTIKINQFDVNSFHQYLNYYFFDIVGGEVLLYCLCEPIPFFNGYREITMDQVFHVKTDGICELLSNQFYSYQYLDKCFIKNRDDYDLPKRWFAPYYERFGCNYLYLGNIELLKNTIYCNSYIWLAKEILQDYDFDLTCLTYSPIHIPQFEYLVKFKLYNLAFEGSELLKKGSSFKKIFGIGKDYLLFMQENNISYSELKALSFLKKKNMDLVRFVSFCLEDFEYYYNNFHLNPQKIYEYFLKNSFSIDYLEIYMDYLSFVERLGYDMKNKSIIFPADLREEHDRLALQFEIINDAHLEERIHSLSNVLSLNHYEDDQYIIISADSIFSMIDEGSQQHNCLRTYIERYSHNNCQIYFLREKSNINRSFVTIEVLKHKIVQARVRYNELPRKEIMDFLYQWENKLIPVELEEKLA